MKLIVTIVITLVVAMGLAMFAMDDPGYVVLAREPYVVRLPLLMFILLVGLAFAILYLLFNFIVGLFRAPKRYERWRHDSNEKSANKHTMTGYAGLIEGNWRDAERSLLKKLEHNKTPLMNYIGAAYAAHQQGAPERRNHYLDDALARYPDHRLAINLTRSRLLYKSGDVVAARDQLESLHKLAPKNVPVTRLLSDVYRSLGDAHAQIALLPSLKRLRAFPEDELKSREQAAFKNLAASPALLQVDGDAGVGGWDDLPRAKKRDPAIVAVVVRQLIERGDHNGAEKLLRQALKRQFNEDLIYLYGLVKSDYLEYQVRLAKSFEKKNPDNADLLLALARLYRYGDDQEKSREYFEKAIASGARDEALVDLSALLEELGDRDAALALLKQGVDALNPGVRRTLASVEPRGELAVLEEEKGDSMDGDVASSGDRAS